VQGDALVRIVVIDQEVGGAAGERHPSGRDLLAIRREIAAADDEQMGEIALAKIQQVAHRALHRRELGRGSGEQLLGAELEHRVHQDHVVLRHPHLVHALQDAR